MADKVKILIVSDCKVGGKHVDKGTVIDIDPEVASDRNNYALLVHAGRIADATEENVKKVKAEIAAAKEIAEAHAKAHKAAQPMSIQEIVAAVVAAMKTAKA